MKTKKCSKCGAEKPLTAFYKRVKGKETLRSECKRCSYPGNTPLRREKAAVRHQATFVYNSTSRRAAHLKQRYGITLEDYVSLLEQQGGVCALCGKPEQIRSKMLAVHHNHKTGKVQALLCFRCNTGLGQLNDDPALLQQGIRILRRKGR